MQPLAPDVLGISQTPWDFSQTSKQPEIVALSNEGAGTSR